MPSFKFHVGQQIDSTYVVEDATSLDEAWDLLIGGDIAECVEQIPGPIITTLKESGVAVLVDGDWQDIDH